MCRCELFHLNTLSRVYTDTSDKSPASLKSMETSLRLCTSKSVTTLWTCSIPGSMTKLLDCGLKEWFSTLAVHENQGALKKIPLPGPTPDQLSWSLWWQLGQQVVLTWGYIWETGVCSSVFLQLYIVKLYLRVCMSICMCRLNRKSPCLWKRKMGYDFRNITINSQQSKLTVGIDFVLLDNILP